MSESDPLLDPLRAQMRKALVKYLVQKAIFCPRTGAVLDVRKCVVLNDRDGDPCAVVSQEGWKQIVAEGGDVKLQEAAGVTVDETTVKP